MTRTSFFVLALSLVGCGGGRHATTACAALVTCCDTGLPAGVGNACSELASSTEESACSQALSEIQAASYCQDVSTDKGPPASSDAHSCDRYLSCLLAAEPESYAAALELYGSGSACWSNSAQTAGCNQACDAAFADIGSECMCTGDSCTTCVAPTVGSYTTSSPASGDCEIPVGTIEVLSVGADGTASIELIGDAGEFMLTGKVVCGGPSTFTLSDSSSQDSESCVQLTLTLAPEGTQGTYFATLSSTIASECTDTGEPSSCSANATVMR